MSHHTVSKDDAYFVMIMALQCTLVTTDNLKKQKSLMTDDEIQYLILGLQLLRHASLADAREKVRLFTKFQLTMIIGPATRQSLQLAKSAQRALRILRA